MTSREGGCGKDGGEGSGRGFEFGDTVVRAMGLVRGGCPFEDACLRICLVGGRDVLLV